MREALRPITNSDIFRAAARAEFVLCRGPFCNLGRGDARSPDQHRERWRGLCFSHLRGAARVADPHFSMGIDGVLDVESRRCDALASC
jgi:hypothetical protein